MDHVAELREAFLALGARLQGDGRDLHGIYLSLAPLIGRVQAMVTERTRAAGNTERAQQAEVALSELKGSARRVGLDIRLASSSALRIGLETVLQLAMEALDRVERLGSEDVHGA